MALSAALAAIALTLCGPANSAPSAPVETRQLAINNGNELVVVVRKLIADGEYDGARQVIRAWRPNEPTYPYRVQYVEGLIQKAQGDYPAAIATFRKILADKPSFSFVRIDLADTLYLAKDDDAAKHQAEMLIASGVDDRIGGSLKAIVGDIDRRRPVRFRAFASVLPSSNINVGTDQRILYIGGLPFLIGEDSRRRSGVGLLVGGEAQFRHELNETYALVGNAGLTARMFPSIDRTDISVDLSAGVERKIERGIVTVSAVGEQDYQDMEAAFWSVGGRFEISRYVGESGRIYSSTTITARDYIDSDFRDGWRAEFSGFYDHFLGASRFARLIGGSVYERTDYEGYSFDEYSGGVGFYNEFPMGFTAYAQTTYARREYKAPLPFFDIRKDDRFEAQVTLTKRDFNIYGLAPQLTYSFVRNVSTSAFDDYTSHGVDIRLVKDF